MSGFDEKIVREYFELNGFLVRQINKFSSKPKQRIDDAIDFHVMNPAASFASPSASFQLFGNDVPLVHNAVVIVHGWAASRFSPAIMKSNAKTLEFIRRDVIGKADTLFDADLLASVGSPVRENEPPQRLLIIPHLPTADPQRAESIELLRSAGVESVITFTSILEKLLRTVDVNPSYQRSELLQFVRILKIYDMVQEPQMHLFGR